MFEVVCACMVALVIGFLLGCLVTKKHFDGDYYE